MATQCRRKRDCAPRVFYVVTWREVPSPGISRTIVRHDNKSQSYVLFISSILVLVLVLLPGCVCMRINDSLMLTLDH